MEDEQAIRQRIEDFLADASAWAQRNDILEYARTGDESCFLRTEAEIKDLVRRHATDERALEQLTNDSPFQHVPGLEVVQRINVRASDSAAVETVSGKEPDYVAPFEYEMRKVGDEWRISYLRRIWGCKEVSVTDADLLARLQKEPPQPPPSVDLPQGLEALFEGPCLIRTSRGEQETQCSTLEGQISISSGWMACDDSSDWHEGVSIFTVPVPPGKYAVHEVQGEFELIAVKIVFAPNVPVARHACTWRVGARGIADVPHPHSHGIYARSCVGLADAALLCSMSPYKRQLAAETAVHRHSTEGSKSRVNFQSLQDEAKYAELSTNNGGAEAWWALDANDSPVALYLNTGNLTWPYVKEFSVPVTASEDFLIEHPTLVELGVSAEWSAGSATFVVHPNLHTLTVRFAVTDALGEIVKNFDDSRGCGNAEDRTEEYLDAGFQMPTGGRIHVRCETGQSWKILPPVQETRANSSEAFTELWNACGCKDVVRAANWHRKIARSYQGPSPDGWRHFARHYHNWRHLTSCLVELEEARVHFDNLDLTTIEMALWLHDVIYNPKANNNEEESVRAAKFMLEDGHAPQELISKVTALILATKTHPSETDADTALLLDIDLSILGKSPEEYDAYEEAIREEYGWVPQATFADRRHRILEKFLTRPQIYLTPYFRERYEAQARANITRALHHLPLLSQ